MDSANGGYTISSQETLLHIDHQQPFPSKKTRIKNLKKIIIFALVILVILIAVSIILSSICKKKPKPNTYVLRLSKYYCHLTPHSDLCYSSMSSIINTTVLQSNPSPIFTTALQIAINELNSTSVSITEALSSPAASNPVVGPRLSKCRTLVHGSLNLLNRSLGLLGVDSDIESLTYMEMDDFREWTRAARKEVGKCLLTLEEIGDMMMMGGEDEKNGVEKVKLGGEKANKQIINSIWLFNGRESILSDFYNPFFEIDEYFYDYYNYHFQYKSLVCFYSIMYLFLVLLYFLFWRSN